MVIAPVLLVQYWLLAGLKVENAFQASYITRKLFFLDLKLHTSWIWSEFISGGHQSDWSVSGRCWINVFKLEKLKFDRTELEAELETDLELNRNASPFRLTTLSLILSNTVLPTLSFHLSMVLIRLTSLNLAFHRWSLRVLFQLLISLRIAPPKSAFQIFPEND